MRIQHAIPTFRKKWSERFCFVEHEEKIVFDMKAQSGGYKWLSPDAALRKNMPFITNLVNTENKNFQKKLLRSSPYSKR